jgi:hypothetical protein
MYLQRMKQEDLQRAVKDGVGDNEAAVTYKVPKTPSQLGKCGSRAL